MQVSAPSPRIELKIKSQDQDPVYSKYFVWYQIGTQAELSHRNFKVFFYKGPSYFYPTQ